MSGGFGVITFFSSRFTEHTLNSGKTHSEPLKYTKYSSHLNVLDLTWWRVNDAHMGNISFFFFLALDEKNLHSGFKYDSDRAVSLAVRQNDIGRRGTQT